MKYSIYLLIGIFVVLYFILRTQTGWHWLLGIGLCLAVLTSDRVTAFRALEREFEFKIVLLLVQADAFTNSLIATVVAIVITSNLRLATAPGNVLLRAAESGLPQDSVVNVSQIVTLDKQTLDAQVGQVTARTLILPIAIEQLTPGTMLTTLANEANDHKATSIAASVMRGFWLQRTPVGQVDVHLA